MLIYLSLCGNITYVIGRRIFFWIAYFMKILSNYNSTIAIKRLTVLKPHQFDSKFMLLKKRHGQCTSITMLHDIIISLPSTVQKKRCFQSINRGCRKSGKS